MLLADGAICRPSHGSRRCVTGDRRRALENDPGLHSRPTRLRYLPGSHWTKPEGLHTPLVKPPAAIHKLQRHSRCDWRPGRPTRLILRSASKGDPFPSAVPLPPPARAAATQPAKCPGAGPPPSRRGIGPRLRISASESSVITISQCDNSRRDSLLLRPMSGHPSLRVGTHARCLILKADGIMETHRFKLSAEWVRAAIAGPNRSPAAGGDSDG